MNQSNSSIIHVLYIAEDFCSKTQNEISKIKHNRSLNYKTDKCVNLTKSRTFTNYINVGFIKYKNSYNTCTFSY